MVRISKQNRDRSVSRRRPAPPAKKTGPRQENLEGGFKKQANAIEGDAAQMSFIPKIK